ncbi:MAG: radical SAM protein [Elusimicrobiota bacterium]
MKVGLVYPPSLCRDNECFPIPGLALPGTANALRRAGHEARFFDFDIRFHPVLRDPRRRRSLELLADRRKVPAYLRGELPPEQARAVRSVQKALLGLRPLEKCGLYDITLDYVVKDLNAAALIAQEIKRRFSAPVALDYSRMGRRILPGILRAYPVFDYAVWGNAQGPMLRLAQRLEGKAVPLVHTWARRGSEVVEHVGATEGLPHCGPGYCHQDFAGYPLEEYKVKARDLLRRYEGGPRFARALGDAEQIIVPYRFETTCRGCCAFCDNDPAAPSDRKSPEETVDDLLTLKKLGVTGVFFRNPSFNNDYDFTSRLCDRMIEAGLGLQWSDYANLRSLDEQLLRKMRDAGAVRLDFGMETGSDRLFRYVRKGVTREKAERWLRCSHELGLWNQINVVGGLPTETDEDIRETVGFLRASARHVDTYAVNPFYLYREAPFYLEAGKFGLRPLPSPAGGEDYFSADARAGYVTERFDEIGGLAWAEKDAQIRRSARTVAETIAEVSSFGVIDQDHTHLLMYLYGRLGYGRKDLIRRIFKSCSRSFKPYHMPDFYRCRRYPKQDYVRVAQPAAGER